MLMADTMAIFLVVLGFLLALPALWLLCAALWPETSARAFEKTERNIAGPFLAGLPITIVILIIASAVKNVFGSAGAIGAGAIICLYLVFASTGMAGLATTIGKRLKSPADLERPWKATLRGAIVLELTYLLPILGWFLILPASFVIGTGAITMSLVKFKRERATLTSDTNEYKQELT